MGSILGAPPDYRSAVSDLAFALRPDRRVLHLLGKSPGEMLKGLLTNRLPPRLSKMQRGPGLAPSVGDPGGCEAPEAEAAEGEGVEQGEVVYAVLLTPKGKMVTDVRVFTSRRSGYLLDVPAVGEAPALAHFRKYLPPRLASVERASGETMVLTLMGPRGPFVLAQWLFGTEASGWWANALQGLVEGQELVPASSPFGPLRVTGNGDLGAPAWDVLGSPGGLQELGSRLRMEGAEMVTESTREVLRIEKGRPAFGVDMDGDTIPVEAGIQERAIDYGKGCYTGQEVIVRIRDRGHVNRYLRGLLLGEAPVPRAGEELFGGSDDGSVGRVTSACRSPAYGQTLALAYVGRRVEPGEEVHLGSPVGPVGQVRVLDENTWPGEPGREERT